MAKELKANTEFELTEDFWKKYKPDSVKETGLSGALRDYEKKLKEAQKLDDSTASPVAKANKWGEVRAALHDLTAAIPKAIDSLGKEKDSHKNLKASLEKVHKSLKAKTHLAYEAAEGKAVLPTEHEDVGGAEWNNWIKKVSASTTDSHKDWKSVLEKFQELTQGIPEDRQLEAALSEMRKTSRKAYLEKMTGPRSFDNDAERLANSYDSCSALVNQYVRKNENALRQRMDDGKFTEWKDLLLGCLRVEALFWRTLQKAKKPT
jgi:hypothetical protein